MIQLKVPALSAMDSNIQDEWELSEFYEFSHWIRYIESLPYVKSARLVFRAGDNHTLITFENEAHKNWFILRYS
jgi:hypothetical protein